MFEVIIITALTLILSAMGTISGFGIATIMIPILSLFLPFGQTMLLVGIIHWFNNLFRVILFQKNINWKLFLFFGFPGMIMSFLGAYLISYTANGIATRFLGAFIIAYVVLLFLIPTFQVKKNHKTAIIGGSISGFCAGIFGIQGAIRSIFLTVFNLPKMVYIATGGAIALVIDTVRVGTYWLEGFKLSTNLYIGLLFIIPATLLGTYSARFIVDYIPQKYFRNVVAIFLLIIGIKLLIIP